MDNSFKNLIDSATSILILLPTKPYLDQVAAGLGIYLSLKANKDVSISAPSPMTVEFSRLIGVDKITNELGNKNLVITFPNYQANDIERVSYDIENGQFKLTVIPKPGFSAPTQEQTNVSYSGAKADLILLIGGANESHFPAIQGQDFRGVKMIHIGTRLLEVTSDNQILSFARPASSTSELVSNLIRESELQIDADIATNLLAGIEDGSKNFQNPEVTSETFSLFAQLLNMGGQRLKKVAVTDFPQGSIPTQPYTQTQRPTQQFEQIPQDKNQELVEKVVQGQDIPQSWSEPKIYTGTSVS